MKLRFKKSPTLVKGLASIFMLFLFPTLLMAQTKLISGVVTDETGKPIEGVSVIIKNEAGGTTTDNSGKFLIKVINQPTLVFTSINYETKEIAIEKQQILNIQLKAKDAVLADVVVVGYGTQKKASVTGAISVISNKMIENRPVTNAVDALQGLAPGLIVTRSNGQPGQEGWNLNIRGFASFNGTNNPLVIVDGVEYADLTMVNPNDVDNISVLKDAAAAAIYGAKAANGVLLITTKKGASGVPTRVTYSGLFTTKRPMEVAQRNHSYEDAAMQNLANINNGGSAAFNANQLRWMQSSDSNFVPSDPSKGYYYYDVNPIPGVIRTSIPSQTHNVDIKGGNDKNQFFIGMGYYGSTGIFKFGPDANQRYNARLNYATKFNKIFSLDSRVSFTENKIQAPCVAVSGDYGLIYNLYAIRELYPVYMPGDDTKWASTGGATTTYADLKDGGYTNTNQDILDGVFTFKADNILKGFSLRAVFSPHLEQDNYNNLTKTIPTWAYNAATGTFAQTTFINPTNSVTEQRITQKTVSTNFLADYDITLAKKHHFHVLGGYQYQYYNYDLVQLKNSSLVNNNLGTVNYTSLALLAPSVVADNLQTNVWISYFGRLNYDYLQKYYFEATLRNDASSRLAPGHQQQTFPSVSVGWRVSQEEWFKKALPIFNEFKLRGSWGVLGNAQLGKLYIKNYDYITTLTTGVYPFNNAATPYVYQASLPSPGLGWETISTEDGGLDLTLLKNRLTFSFDYFLRQNNNMLIVLNQPAILGVTPSTTNAAAMEAKGWELTLGWKDRVGAVSYWINGNLSDNQNKITKYLGNVVYSEGLNTAIPGNPINSIYGYQSLGYFQTASEVSSSPVQFNATRQGPGDIKYQDVNGDGKINGGVNSTTDHGDLVYLGNTSPRYNFGFNLGAQWKGFDFSIFFQGTGKRNIILYPSQAIPWIDSWRNPMANYKDNYWTVDNPNALFPRPIAGGSTNAHINSAFVQNTAYIRLKNLQAGYTFPVNFLKKSKLQTLRVFMTAQDIWTKTKMWYAYFDPESPNNVQFNYPYSSSWAFGVNVSF